VQSGSCAIIKCRHRLDQFQASAHCSLGIFLVCLRIAEIGEYAVAHVSRDKTAGFRDDLGATALIGADDLPQVFRIEPGRERCRTDKISEHHCKLTPLGFVPARRLRRSYLIEHCNRAQYFLAMPERDSDFFEVLVSQIAENARINVVVGKTQSV
jgi:hypothetical protein